MKKLDFICTFKSDIVLHATSNTEGKIDKLDYIPGSNFLGMVARKYPDFGSDAFDVFHSGAVCFGDAHIILNNMPTFQVPFSFYAFKGVSFTDAMKKNELVTHHFLTQDDFVEATEKGTQYKQQRIGFMTAEGNLAKLEHSYRQKSAYDKKKRRSKESTMFGYYALPAKTKWAFSVTLDESMSKYEEKIVELLESAHRLGKSKSAEYGLVEIKHQNSTDNLVQPSIAAHKKSYFYLYAKSRLVLTDDYSINSYAPNIESLGFSPEDKDKVKIDWGKTQIRTSRYTPYVGARRNFDPERLVINKGSVIVVEVEEGYDAAHFTQNIQKPIGLYISEGHGEVIVNPSWLLEKEVKFNASDENKSQKSNDSKEISNNALNSWLSTQREGEEKQALLLEQVRTFIKDNNVKNKKSQWGQIRSLCRQSKDSTTLYGLLFSRDKKNGHEKGFLRHGRAMEKWDNGLIDSLESMKNTLEDKKLDLDYRAFVTLLSIYAPKEDDKKENAKKGGD